MFNKVYRTKSQNCCLFLLLFYFSLLFIVTAKDVSSTRTSMLSGWSIKCTEENPNIIGYLCCYVISPMLYIATAKDVRSIRMSILSGWSIKCTELNAKIIGYLCCYFISPLILIVTAKDVRSKSCVHCSELDS